MLLKSEIYVTEIGYLNILRLHENTGYPPTYPQNLCEMWITLWKNSYFYAIVNMISFVTICELVKKNMEQ